MSVAVNVTRTLNDDILRELFHVVAALEPPQSTEDVSQNRVFTGGARPLVGGARALRIAESWVRLTHVCQRWRDILLGTGLAHLWGRITFTLPSNSAFPILLSRSRNAPLDVVLDTSISVLRAGLVQRVQEALTNLSRIRYLRLHSGPSQNLMALFSHHLSLPLLQELYLELEYDDADQLHNSAVVDTPLPSHIHIEGPNVRTASVELVKWRPGVAYPTLRFLFNTLRHLEVHVLDRTRPIDFAWLIILLRDTPSLEVLYLDLYLSDHAIDWEAILSGDPIHLPYLRELTLGECWNIDFTPFVAQVCVNALAYIFASCEIPQDLVPVEDVPQPTLDFIHSFGGYLCRPGHLALQISVKTCRTDGDRFRVHFQSMPTLDESEILGGLLLQPLPQFYMLEDTVEIAFEVRSIYPFGQAWLEPLSSSLNNKELIEQLDLCIPGGLSDGWMEALRQHMLLPMIGLRNLYIWTPGHGEIDLHNWTKAVDLLRPSEPCIFPVLHTLVVPFLAIDRDQRGHGILPIREWWEPLIEVLTQRHAQGHPIHTVRIVGRWTADTRRTVQSLEMELVAQLDGAVDDVVDDRVDDALWECFHGIG